jgi:hypothetical protein
MSLAPIATVEYLKTSRPLASNHNLGVAVAELNLSNRPPSGVNLPENYRRATHDAPRSSTRARITASPDLNSPLARDQNQVRASSWLSITRPMEPAKTP